MLKQCFPFFLRMGSLIGTSTYPVRQNITLGNWTQHVWLSSVFILLKGLFNHTRSPHLKTVIPYMRGHSCARTAAEWTGMCRLSRPWRTGLWAHSASPPFPGSPLPAHPDLSQHHHPGLSPGVQLASGEWIDTLTWPREVCARVCICACLWKGGRRGELGVAQS